MSLRRCIALAALCAVTPVHAQRWQAEAGAGIERLSTDAPNWREADLALRVFSANRSFGEISARRSERYDQADREFGVAGALVEGGWTMSAGLRASPTHVSLARSGLRLGISRNLGDGWVMGLVGSRQLFDRSDSVDATIPGTERVVGASDAALEIERYAGAWRFAASAGRARLDQGALASAESGNHGRVQIDRFYGDERGRIGIVVGGGKEFENVPPSATRPAAITSLTAVSLALVGVHPLDSNWSLTWALSSTRSDSIETRYADGALAEGKRYYRNGVHLGVRVDF